jgi:chromosome segregation ATPase
VINVPGVVIESLVSILLLITIIYCTILNKRIKRLRSDEQSLKATISELITATEIAERAIAGLKVTVRDCDQTLGERLRSAERFSADIERQIRTGEAILNRLGRIVAATRSAEENAAPTPPDTQAVAAAAHAFAERARSRVNGRAA